jgi:hypothetical protein
MCILRHKLSCHSDEGGIFWGFVISLWPARTDSSQARNDKDGWPHSGDIAVGSPMTNAIACTANLERATMSPGNDEAAGGQPATGGNP